MLPTKMVFILWLLGLFFVSVNCGSFVLVPERSEKLIAKRDVEAVETPITKENSTKPDIYSFVITSNITYRYAITTVSNRVANAANVSKEVSFTVTLPDSAFISRFLMVIKDKVYEAYVKEKEEAKKDYEAAVDRGETAGHVELSARDSNLFTVRVNVEPSSKVTFNLTYEQLLTRTLGQYENIINVNPGQRVKTFQIEVNIEESAPITYLEVPDFKIGNEIDAANSKSINTKIEQPTNNTAKITWVPDVNQQQQISEDGAKGQFIVRYDVDRTANANQILVDEGYFVHFYAPSNLKTLNKHVLFALDISGSMGGRKIEQLREALILILSDIGEGDFFSIILFSDNVQLWTLKGTIGEASPTWYYEELKTTTPPDVEINERFIIPANPENIAKAKAFASTLNETGGTNIIAALRKSLDIAQWGQKTYAIKAKPLIIFLTDGQPNVEMSDTEEIIKAVKKQNVDKFPLFSLAFGDGADYDFLRKLSLSNSGFARNIYVASDTSLQLTNFYKQVASPLLSNVSFEYIPGQVDENSLTKSVFNNMYNGSELVVAGRRTNNSDSLTGNMTGVAWDGYFCVEMPPLIPTKHTPGHLEKLWAYLYIKELLDKDLISDEKNSTFKQKALKLSLQYGFVTPLTSLVVVKPNETTSDAQTEGHGTLISGGANLAMRGPPGLMNAPMPMSGVYAQSASSMMKVHVLRGGSINNYYMSSMNSPTIQGGLGSTYLMEDLILPTQTFLDSANTTVLENPSEALNISSLTWLQNKTYIEFPSSNNTYSVFSGDAPNNEFQACIVPNSNNTVSHCRHLAHCIIPEILDSYDAFKPYGEDCVIDARFVGICCPPSHQSSIAGPVPSPTPSTVSSSSGMPAP